MAGHRTGLRTGLRAGFRKGLRTGLKPVRARPMTEFEVVLRAKLKE